MNIISQFPLDPFDVFIKGKLPDMIHGINFDILSDFLDSPVQWQQDKYGKEVREETEGKYGKVHRVTYEMKRKYRRRVMRR